MHTRFLRSVRQQQHKRVAPQLARLLFRGGHVDNANGLALLALLNANVAARKEAARWPNGSDERITGVKK
jgi:hypothetical protein